MEILETFDKYLNVSRNQAYNQFLDERNLKIMKVMLSIFGFITAVMFAVNLAEDEAFNIPVILSLINFIIIVSLIIFYKKLFNLSNIRRYIFIFLIFQLFFLLLLIFPDRTKLKITKRIQLKIQRVKYFALTL